MNLSQLSDEDLRALSAGNLAGMSDAGFALLVKEREKATPRSEKLERTRAQMAEQFSPTVGMSGPELFAAGAGKSVADVGRAVSQAVGQTTRSDVGETRRLDAPLMATGAGKAGNVTGLLSQGLLAGMLPGAQTILGGAAYGGGLGALTPVGEGESVLSNALPGALLGAGINAATKAGRGVLAPSATPEAQRLRAAGVQLTPGQQMGGALQRIEEGATSIPVVGDTIRSAQRRSVEGFNAAVANRALKPIGRTLPKGLTGHDAVAHVESAIGDVYESAIKRAGSIKADQQMAGELASLRQMVRGSPMPAEVKAQFDAVVDAQLSGKLQGQSAMTARTFKEADSEIGRLAAKYSGDASVDKQLLGDALQETQAIMRRWLQRATPADVSADVAAANKGWAEFKRFQRAAGMQGSSDGVFSAEAYRAAVRALDRSKDKGAFARGDALGQDIARDAVAALGRKVPDSGTPMRSLITNPIQGTIAGVIGSPIELLYSNPRALSAVQTLLSGQRPALATKAAAELEMIAPYLSMLGTSAALANERGGR